MSLFGRKKEIESDMTAKDSLQTEVKDLDKLSLEEDSVEIPELPQEFTKLKEVAAADAEKITKDFEEPRLLLEPTEEKREIELDESSLKELNEKIDEELKVFRKRMKDLGNLTRVSLESQEMIELMDLYTEAMDKLNQFVEEINRMDLSNLSSKKTFAAIYKFRACKGLSEIKREIRKMESICKKAGFVPAKIQEILSTNAENLIDGFLRKSPKDE
jgi:ElaB/YqjD/DUF883 family membrane-anchored ribosome-binding protein